MATETETETESEIEIEPGAGAVLEWIAMPACSYSCAQHSTTWLFMFQSMNNAILTILSLHSIQHYIQFDSLYIIRSMHDAMIIKETCVLQQPRGFPLRDNTRRGSGPIKIPI